MSRVPNIERKANFDLHFQNVLLNEYSGVIITDPRMTQLFQNSLSPVQQILSSHVDVLRDEGPSSSQIGLACATLSEILTLSQ